MTATTSGRKVVGIVLGVRSHSGRAANAAEMQQPRPVHHVDESQSLNGSALKALQRLHLAFPLSFRLNQQPYHKHIVTMDWRERFVQRAVGDFSTGLPYRHDRPRAYSISTRTNCRCLATIRSTYHSRPRIATIFTRRKVPSQKNA